MSTGEGMGTSNIDRRTVADFGREWAAFDQTSLDPAEHRSLFDQYFGVFPFADLPSGAEGFDLGCGSGRWAALVAPKVGKLHCIDPAQEALDVCRRRLAGCSIVEFHLAGADAIPLPDGSQDFGYSRFTASGRRHECDRNRDRHARRGEQAEARRPVSRLSLL